MKMSVPQKNHVVKEPFILLRLIANFTIWSMVVFVFFIDIVVWIYQEIYFGIKGIPKIPRSKYVVVRRHLLAGLNPFQKLNCAYCEYTNGVVLWLKAVTNQTEIYSCAIKYSHMLPTGLEYQKNFYDQKEFENRG